MCAFELRSGIGSALLLCALACGGPPPAASAASPAAKPAEPASDAKPDAKADAKAVLAQELGEAPAPTGPCPERTEPHVLQNPRAAVHRTALGLAYCMLEEGPPGVVPGATDTVKVNYSGWTEEGELFDSSVERGPADLPLNGVIRGWGEGLRLMTPGDKARLWIPGNLGYGQRVPGEAAGTPPRGTLIFDVELLSIERGPAKEGAAEAAPKQEPDESRPTLTPRPVPGATPAGSGSGKKRRSAFQVGQ
jgi:FKBP-type peptidyl-prolyl cis-trans isomerase